MRKFHKISLALATVSVIIFFVGCKKDGIETSNNESQNNSSFDDQTWRSYPLDTTPGFAADDASRILSYPATSYVSVPNNNVFQASPASSVAYGGVTYYGGPFQASTYSVSGNIITFQMKRTDGFTFPVGSVLKIKLTNAGGTVMNTITLTAAASSYNLHAIESNTWNLSGGSSSNPNNTSSYVLTWYNPSSGLTFYTLPIKIVAVPTGWGTNLSSFGVPIYSNGWGGFLSTNNLKDVSYNNSQMYQCVHYIQKYYLAIKSKNIGNANAGDYWNSNTSHSLTQKVLNGNGVPQQGDIVCFYNTNSGSYHVGIAGGVNVSGFLRVFQENVGQTLVNGNYCSGYKDMAYANNGSGYNVSAATLGSNWVTLGWVR
ncbi:MAG TPA: CHAP domain-containing protein [Bacteroidia bacterium]|nr:CHAP domain-containing protein [Bacteroidia bacterium]HRH08755.1 CHAP domain-containing protein [Bacteroidia bacterium]